MGRRESSLRRNDKESRERLSSEWERCSIYPLPSNAVPLFLPSYSPDFSPIEEAFSKLKAVLRRVGARTPEILQEVIGEALLTITPQDAFGWFTHCGYQAFDPLSPNILLEVEAN
jgi:transposase